jgi:5-methylcytosine-specific restriction enzyme A
MARAARTCSGCPAVVPAGQSRCTSCTRQADRARGTAAQRGYTSGGHQRFRTAVLARDPLCVVCRKAWSTVADHHPVSRRDLVTAGDNPNDPARGRGLCHRCHSIETAKHQPGGWANQ